jgi:hypothetical protein
MHDRESTQLDVSCSAVSVIHSIFFLYLATLAAVTSFKMAPSLTTEQKTRTVEWFVQTNSNVTVQRRFKNQYKCKEAPARKTAKTSVEQLRATGNATCSHARHCWDHSCECGLISNTEVRATVSRRKRGIARDSMTHTSKRSTHASVQDPCLPISDNCVPRKEDEVCGGIR